MSNGVGVPGQNVLRMALTLIHKQCLRYYQFSSRALNSVGQDVTTYLAPVTMRGSWQPVPRKVYMQYGLDFQKDYYTFYTSNDVLDIQRDVSGDQLIFNGKRYQVESNNDWFPMDGWKGIICVYIEDDAGDWEANCVCQCL